ncbi:glutamate--cysteine ligase [bacterium]|nr:glutamate--cysteine ligase [bacterium]
MNTTADTLSHLSYSDIKNIYISGFKPKSDLKIGLEYERLPVNCIDGQAAAYCGENGICEFLRSFARFENWDYITDNLNIIGLKQCHDTITLEPGCQLEFSLEPKTNISELEQRVNTLDNLMKPFLEQKQIKLLKYGVSPVSTYKNIRLIPKKRYEIMAKYLWGILADVMMRETAGIQGTFDFTDEEDAMRKFRIANMLSPFVTAMFANSPIRGGVDTGYKSFRALSWLNTDNDRCGFFCDFDDVSKSFDSYIDKVLEIPMLFINRNDEPFVISGDKNFKDYMEYGHAGFNACMEDYLLQANLCFPEVRLRNFIEVRNHDCCNGSAPFAMLALYKGILYSDTAIEDIEALLKDLSKEDYTELRYNVPKYALQTPLKNGSILPFAKEIVSIAEHGLREAYPQEAVYLEYIKQYITDGLSPADVTLKNWYGSWNKNIDNLLAYYS